MPETHFPMPLNFRVIDTSLAEFPDVPGAARRRDAKLIGAAGEAFVDSILMRHGLRTWSTGETHHADRAIEIAGWHFSLQVKTVTAPIDGTYRFAMQHGYHLAPRGRRPYGRDAFDIAALVVLAENVVKFVPNLADSYTIRVRDIGPLRLCPIRSLDDSLHAVMSATHAAAV